MIINKIAIKAYGKLENFTIDFNAGVNTVYGANEHGKSTIMQFIRMMFYGNGSAPRTIEGNARKHYEPWSGSKAGGSIFFTHEGKNYRLTRTFGKSVSADKLQLFNETAGAEVELPAKAAVGEALFGMTEGTFERTVFIDKVGAVGADESITKTLQSLASTGDSTVSFETACGRIEAAQKELFSNGRVNKGKINALEDRLSDYKSELEDARMREIRVAEIEKTAATYDSESNELSRELDSLNGRIDRQADRAEEQKLGRLLKKCERRSELLTKAEAIRAELTTESGTLDRDGAAELRSIVTGIESTEEELKKRSAAVTDIPEANGDDGEADNRRLHELLNSQSELTAKQRKLSEERTAAARTEEAGKNYSAALERLARTTAESEEKQRELAAARSAESDCAAKSEKLTVELSGLNKKREQLLGELENYAVTEPPTLPMTGKSTGAMLLMVLGMIVVLAAAGLFFLNPLLALIAVIGAAMFVAGLALSAKRSAQNGWLIAEYNAKLAERDNAAAKKDSVKAELEAAKQAIVEKENELSEQRLRLSELEKRSAQLGQEAAVLEARVADSRRSCEELKPLNSNAEPFDEDAWRAVNAECAELQSELTALMKKIGAVSAKEADDLYYEKAEQIKSRKAAFAAAKKEIEQIAAAETELVGKKNAFAGFMERFGAADYAAAVSKVSELEERLSLLGELTVELTTLERQIDEEAVGKDEQTLRAEYDELCANNSSDCDNGETPEELREKADELTKKINELRSSASAARREAELSLQSNKGAAELENAIAVATAEKAELEGKCAALQLAEGTMQSAFATLQQTFAPVLNTSAAQILGELTDGRYGSVAVSRELAVSATQGNDGFARDFQYLSTGTIDQAYFALRIAVSEIFAGQNGFTLPLIMDDCFVHYDDERRQRAVDYLKGLIGDTRQAIFFTCRESDCIGNVIEI